MHVCTRLEEFPTGDRPVTLAIGAFDGIHLGHQSVVAQAKRLAAAEAGEAWLLSFDPHPLQVVRPDACPPMLTTRDQQQRLLDAEGLDGLWRAPFDTDLAKLAPEAFLDRLKRSVPQLSAIVVGENWRFGHRASGDVTTLRTWCDTHDVQMHPTVITEWADQRVSSSRIRSAILAGDLEDAAALLGRGYAITGQVVPGAQEGRALGFPTINVQVDNELLPPPGIYAGIAELEGQRIHGAGYITERKRDARLAEMHLLDFNRDVYGQQVALTFLKRTREDAVFTDLDTLKTRIARDIRDVRAYFE